MIETSGRGGWGARMPEARRLRALLALALVLLVPASSFGQPTPAPPDGAARAAGRDQVSAIAFQRPAQAVLADHRAVARVLGTLRPQRAGIVDAYVVVAALDSDPVFGREAREAKRVLARRFDAEGRAIILADGADGKTGAPGSPAHLAMALARVAELMDRREDVLVLYTTSHGSAKAGLAYRDKARGLGAIPPRQLAGMLDGLGIANRLVLLSACYSGIFVPHLASDTSIIISAAAADRTSFGCNPSNDWTFFGDALINRALRKPQPLGQAFAEADGLVAGWEKARKLPASSPQLSIGGDTPRWLARLEKRMPPTATTPVGRPSAPVALK